MCNPPLPHFQPISALSMTFCNGIQLSYSAVIFSCHLQISHSAVIFGCHIRLSYSDITFRNGIQLSHSEMAFVNMDRVAGMSARIRKNWTSSPSFSKSGILMSQLASPYILMVPTSRTFQARSGPPFRIRACGCAKSCPTSSRSSAERD